MKKFRVVLTFVMCAAMCAMLLAGCGSSSGGNDDTSGSGGSETTTASSSSGNATYEFSMTYHDAEDTLKAQYMQEWCDKVEEATDGQVHIELYCGGTLAASTDALDAVKTGLADIGVCFTSLTPGQFPLLEAVSLPMMGMLEGEISTQVLWDIWEEYEEVQEELSGYKVMMLYCNPDGPISTADTAVHTPDDLKNLNLRVTSGTPADMIQAWGGNGQSMSPSEIYEQLEKHSLDGCIMELSGISSWNLYEVLNYYTIFDGTGFYAQPWVILMNEDSWNSLPEDLQEKIDEVSDREMSIGMGKVIDEEVAATIETIESDYPNAEIIHLTEDEIAQFQPAATAYIEDWIEGCGDGNFASAEETQAFVDRILELAEKYGSE